MTEKTSSVTLTADTFPTGEGLTGIDAKMLGAVVHELMRPIIEGLAKALENNTAALEQLSAAQSIQNDRLEALEKQVRLQTPVTGQQVSYINQRIRGKAYEILDKKGVNDKKAVTKLCNQIRKTILARYGIGCLRELPKHEYSVAMYQVDLYSDGLFVRDLVREYRNAESVMVFKEGEQT